MIDLSPVFGRVNEAVAAFAAFAPSTIKPEGSAPPRNTSARLVDVLAPWREARDAANSRLAILSKSPGEVDAEIFKGAMAHLHTPTSEAAALSLDALREKADELDRLTFDALAPEGQMDATKIDMATRAWRSISDAYDALLCAGVMAHAVMSPRRSALQATPWTASAIKTDAAPTRRR